MARVGRWEFSGNHRPPRFSNRWAVFGSPQHGLPLLQLEQQDRFTAREIERISMSGYPYGGQSQSALFTLIPDPRGRHNSAQSTVSSQVASLNVTLQTNRMQSKPLLLDVLTD